RWGAPPPRAPRGRAVRRRLEACGENGVGIAAGFGTYRGRTVVIDHPVDQGARDRIGEGDGQSHDSNIFPYRLAQAQPKSSGIFGSGDSSSRSSNLTRAFGVNRT